MRSRPLTNRMLWLRGVALLALAALVGVAWLLFGPAPSPADLARRAVAPSTIIYDRNARVLYEILDPQLGRHQRVPLDEIPLALRQATIATEDADFYSNPGVDLRGILRAVWINLRGGQVLSGGSTITQQLARTLLLSPDERTERTLWRKLRESVFAWRIARAYTKDQVLELYLNQVYYGNLSYGVQAAARSLFAKSVRELDLAECALLAGLPQAPATYDPLTNLAAAKARQATVLQLMARHGYITAEQAEAAAEEPLAFAAVPFPIRAPHFVMYVWEALREQFGEEAIYRHGLRVYTTLDIDLQERARDIARRHVQLLSTPRPGRPAHNVTNAAVAALDPLTGDILVMLGSVDYFAPAIDGAVNVTLMPRQPGSAIKPLTYAAALAGDYTAATMLLDVPTTFVTREGLPYVPGNYDRSFRGPVLLREALGSSLNVVAVRVLEHIGPERLVALARKAGITTLDNQDAFGLALTLGGGEVRLLDLTATYATLANAGRSLPPRTILRVESAAGELLWAAPPPAAQPVIDERVAFLVTDILADNAARIPAFGESSPLVLTRPAAAKTGTTTDWRDNWTVGYTPDLVVGVWVGNSDNSPMGNVSGIQGAAPIWHELMEEALKGRPVRRFVRPEGLVSAEICAESGKLPGTYCERRQREWFIAGTAPRDTCTMHRLDDLDARTGELATADTPAEYRVQRVMTYLPPEATQWAVEQRRAYGAPYFVDGMSPGAGTTTGAGQPRVRVAHPAPNATYRLSPSVPADAQRIEVAARVEGLAQATVHLYVDGELLAARTAPPYSAFWPLVPGDHSIHAVAIDAEGNAWESEPVTIHVVR